MDAHANFAYSTVQAPAPGVVGTALIVAAGEGALFPAAPFNCTVWPSGVVPLASNAEIVRVTAVVGDTLTIVRAQEGTTPKNIAAGFQIANTTSRKVFTDIESTMITFVAANAVSVTAPGVVFQDGNGVTFGAVGNVITASVNTAGGGVAIAAGTQTQSTGTIIFSNANGITFGLDNGTLTASHNGLTSQSNQAFSASGGSSAFQTLNFANSNGITFSNSNGSVIASYTVPSIAGLISAINVSAGTTSNNLSAITFSNANGVSFGLNGSVITASIPAGAAAGSIAAGTQTFALGQAILSNSNGITFGMDNGTITASHNGLTSQSGQAASASNGSFAFQTLAFSNANNVTFGTSAGGVITASVNPGGGGGATLTDFYPWPFLHTQIGNWVNNSASVIYIQFPNAVSFSRVHFPFNQSVTTAANNSTGGINFSITMVIHTLNAATLSSVMSTTFTTGATVSSNASQSMTGNFSIPVPFVGSLSAGNYWLAFQVSTANTGGVLTGANTTALAFNNSLFGVGVGEFISAFSPRELGQVATTSQGWLPFHGLIAAGSTSNLTNIDGTVIACNVSQNRVLVGLRFN